MITTAQFGGVASAQLIDVANFQGAYDWAAAKRQVPGLAGGIFKVTEGTSFTDPDARHNHDSIAAQGLAARGMYHFLRPADSGAAQARFFAAQLHSLGVTGRDMFWCDNETTDGKSAPAVASCASDFMNELHAQFPRNPMGVYTFLSFATGGENAGLGRWPLWLARPGSTAPVAPPPWAKWTFWQWGLRIGVDADAFNGTTAGLSAWLDSFAPAPAPQPSPQPGTGPFLHTLDGHTTLAEVATARNTTPYKLLRLAAGNYTNGDIAHLAGQTLPAGTRYYTANQ